MTMNHRTSTAPHLAHHTIDFRTVEKVTFLVLVLAAAAYLCFAIHRQSVIDNRTFVLARSAIVSGMSRADCYRWLRAHHLTATNIAFAQWRTNEFGVWYRANDGAWPAPGDTPGAAQQQHPHAVANPEIEFKLALSSLGGCGMTIVEAVTFDRDDRIASIVASDPYWSCR